MKLGKMMDIQDLETLKGGLESMVCDLEKAIENVEDKDFVIESLTQLIFELQDNLMTFGEVKKHFTIRRDILKD